MGHQLFSGSFYLKQGPLWEQGDGVVPRQRAALKGKDLSSHILDTIPCANGQAFEGEERGHSLPPLVLPDASFAVSWIGPPLHMSNQ